MGREKETGGRKSVTDFYMAVYKLAPISNLSVTPSCCQAHKAHSTPYTILSPCTDTLTRLGMPSSCILLGCCSLTTGSFDEFILNMMSSGGCLCAVTDEQRKKL